MFCFARGTSLTLKLVLFIVCSDKVNFFLRYKTLVILHVRQLDLLLVSYFRLDLLILNLLCY